MIKSAKVMLIPNNKQKTKLFQYANTARFAYNWAIAREQENYKTGEKFISDNDLRKELTQLKKTEGYSRFPKFKSRKFSTPSFYQDNCKIQFTETYVKVEGFSSSKKRNKQKLNYIRLAERN